MSAHQGRQCIIHIDGRASMGLCCARGGTIPYRRLEADGNQPLLLPSHPMIRCCGMQYVPVKAYAVMRHVNSCVEHLWLVLVLWRLLAFWQVILPFGQTTSCNPPCFLSSIWPAHQCLYRSIPKNCCSSNVSHVGQYCDDLHIQ